MPRIVALIVAADELTACSQPAGEARAAGDGDPCGELGMLAELADRGCDVWLVTSSAGASSGPQAPGDPEPNRPVRAASRQQGRPQPELPSRGVHRAASLEEAARRCRAEGGSVLVVGADPASSVRFANRHRFSSVLIDPVGSGARPGRLDEIPDFTLPSLSELSGLIRRIERDPADFEGTE